MADDFDEGCVTREDFNAKLEKILQKQTLHTVARRDITALTSIPTFARLADTQDPETLRTLHLMMMSAWLKGSATVASVISKMSEADFDNLKARLKREEAPWH